MKYYDDQGNELNIRTKLDDMLDELYDKLDKMTPEERMAWYSRGMFVKPLKYTQDIDNTIYIVRTNFNENADLTVYDTVENHIKRCVIYHFKVLNLSVGYGII